MAAHTIIAAALAVAVALGLGPAAGAQTGIEPFDDRAAFAAASAGHTTVDFEGLVPNSGFMNYSMPDGLAAGGAVFRTSGGGRFGPGRITIVGAWYNAGPIYETTTGAKLIWGPPQQPGDARLDVTLPNEVTAAGADLWAAQPAVSSVEVTVTTADGRSRTVTVNTPQRPAGAFVGFISETAIVSLSFRPPKGQTGLILDNFTYGRAAEGRSVRASDSPAARGATDEGAAGVAPANRPPSPTGGQTPPAQASRPAAAATAPSAGRPSAPAASRTPAPAATQAPTSASARGTIAYVRAGKEIRLVESDGSNDRRLWTHPDATEDVGINDLAWRPDGAELAFSSGHAAVVSLYHADIYAVRPDGTGLRKITNAPAHGELARYPKGAVSVTVRNDQPIYRQTQASAGIFIVYVVGADEPQSITLPPGSSKTLLFKSVADFGDHAQAVVAMYGQYRWFTPGVDVRAGRTVNAPAFGITGDGVELFGAFRPTWRSDGSRVSYRSGLCIINSAPSQPTPGEHVFQPLFAGKHPTGACAWDWGPGPALADQLIYTDNASGGSSVYRIKEGGTHPGTKLWTFSDIDYQLLLDLRWLPDGSGFLFSHPNLFRDSANIFRYDFTTKRATPLTNFEKEFARRFDLSPDGGWIVFERAKSLVEGKDSDLWVMRADGAGARLLVRDGVAPSWR